MSGIAKPNFHAGKVVILAQGVRISELEAANRTLLSEIERLREDRALALTRTAGFRDVLITAVDQSVDGESASDFIVRLTDLMNDAADVLTIPSEKEGGE
ncbi:hypothetical protein LB517_27915 [Mesorhizobium sp. BR1-1-12]|uniref:hypothetical protein n=1 Tax=Mesorhizobium sp. BR1-1-12 TaxID=2876657 RepID=UPI001CD06A98|nr:hypothetical protein [Mesorhizobium sp. BR1-1-12]MBZ9973460.1 hypothetical protein [Mesorhizobium sp. BR1-1-12]